MSVDSAARARRTMTVALAGDPAAVAAVSDVLKERIAAQELAVAFETVPAVDPAIVLRAPPKEEEAFARVWIDLRGETQSTLYLVDGKGERVLVRSFARQQNPEVTYEAIGHVVELAVTSLRAGELIGVGRDRARAELLPETAAPASPAPAPPPVAREAPPPAPAPRAETRISAGVYYEAQAYGGLDVWSGPGVLVEARRRPAHRRFSFGGLAAVQYRLPAESETTRSPILGFEGAAASVLGTGGVALSRPGELVLGIGPGLELVNVEARGDRAADVRFAADNARIAGLLRALVRYEHALPGVRVTAGVGADVPFQRSRYLIAGPAGSTVLFEAWPVRPFLSFGIQMP